MANKLQLNLSGGMNTKTSSLIIKDSESELVLNYNLDKIGSLTRRAGYATYADQPVAGKTVNGLSPSVVNGNQLMVVNNAGNTQGVIYYSPGGGSPWTAAKTDDTASKKTRFVSFVGYSFRVNGADVVATSPNSATWGTDNAPATIIPNYAAVFQSRVYLANIVGYTSRVYFSSLPSDTIPQAVTWDLNNDWFDVNPIDGDFITALENNGNRLLIFKNRTLYRWTYGQVEADRLIGVGTSSQESVKTNFDVGITFFANQNGVYGYSGSRPRLLSRKIQPFIDAVTDWTNVFAEVDTDHYYLSVGNITVAGRTYTNAMFVYHISLDAWSIYTTANKVTWMTRFNPLAANLTQLIYFGSDNGRAYNFLSGTTDAGSTIAAEWISKEYTLSYPYRTNLTWIDVFASQRVAASVFYDLDRENTFGGIGQLSTRITNFKIPVRECNTFRTKIADNSNNISIIEGFNVEHIPKEKRDEPNVKSLRQTPQTK